MGKTFKHVDKGKYHNKVLKYNDVCESTKNMFERHNSDISEDKQELFKIKNKIAEKELKTELMEFKTIKQAKLEINPTKECKSKKCCKKPTLYLEYAFNQIPKNVYDIKIPVTGVIEKPLLDNVSLEKQFIYNQIRLLVNTTSNDLLLGEAVRKLFS